MKLFTIKDPLLNNQEADNTTTELALGIDLGTTNSVVAVYKNNEITILHYDGQPLIPSVVALEDDNFIVGKPALSLLEKPKHATVFSSIKRLIGKGYEGSEPLTNQLGLSAIPGDNRNIALLVKPESNSSITTVTPEIISSCILKKIKLGAEQQLQVSVNKVVITVPAYFNETERMATKKAAEMAGFEVLRLINEPTAAALAYGLDKGISGNYLIYDLGGGTFDVSILQLNKGVFRVLATNGDLALGGDDFDYLIADNLLTKLCEQIAVAPLDKQEHEDDINRHNETSDSINEYYQNNKEAYLHLVLIAKKLKEKLTTANNASVEIEFKASKYTVNFSSDELNAALSSILQKTISLCKDALNEAKLIPLDLTGIILVGGSSKIPLVSSMIQQEFNIQPQCTLNPEEVVAIGAAYQSANLTGMIKKSLLLDVTPLSLGIETYGGIVEKIIFRNSPIPVSKSQVFTTFQNNQTSLTLHILQGERELVKDNHSLAKFTLKGIPPMPAGVPRIEVNFTIDADGLLTVTAQEQTTKVSQRIEIKPTFGLDFNDIKDMILAGITHAEADMEKRLLENAKVECAHLINITTYALATDKDLISSEEVATIEAIIVKLNKAIAVNNRDNMKLLKEELVQATNNLAAKRLDKSIKEALTGENIDTFNN